MRRPASRPQLKRDPLGGSNGRQHFGGSMRLTAVLAAAVALVGALPTLVAQAPGQTAQVGPQADSTLRHWLRQLVVSQERYYSEHGTYTTDVAALGLFTRPGRAALLAKPDSIYLEVIQAGGRSWWGRARYRGHGAKSCVIWVGTTVDFTTPPTTEGGRLQAPKEGAPVCDTF